MKGENINIYISTYKNLNCIVLENRMLQIAVLPVQGGKICSIMDKKSKKELLWQNSNKKYILSKYDELFTYDEIMEVKGIDVIFVGPYDLSQSMGVPGQVNNDAVIRKMKEVVLKAKQKGKCVGTFVDDIQAGLMWMSEGVKYLSYSVDVGIIYETVKKITQEIKSGDKMLEIV